MADVKEIVTGETQPIVKDDWPQSFLDYIKELEEQIAEEQRISASTRQAQIELNRDRLRLQARVRELEEALKTTCNERDRALAAYMNKESAERERLRTQLEAMTKARDEACDMLVERMEFVKDLRIRAALFDRIAELRKVGTEHS